MMTFIDLENLEKKELVKGGHVRFVHTEKMTFAYWILEQGTEVPLHSHHHEQVVNVIEGEIDLTLDGETRRLVPGQVAVISSNAEHAAKAATACRIIDVFCPVREDYK
jgi:quercetin dioxygenase-like cupin family protein